jgi:hypothetical protein
LTEQVFHLLNKTLLNLTARVGKSRHQARILPGAVEDRLLTLRTLTHHWSALAPKLPIGSRGGGARQQLLAPVQTEMVFRIRLSSIAADLLAGLAGRKKWPWVSGFQSANLQC